mgnify:CR=1 FL=1
MFLTTVADAKRIGAERNSVLIRPKHDLEWDLIPLLILQTRNQESERVDVIP